MKLLLILLFITPVLAADPLELTEDDLNPSSEDILIKRREQHLRHESMIYDLNPTLGIKDQRKFTGSDRNRFSLAGHVSAEYEHMRKLFGGEVTYMRRTTRYNQIWWGAQFFQHQSQFDALTQNHNSGSATSEYNFQRPNDAKNNIMGFGPGVGYRFKLLLDFLDTDDVFESVDVFVNALELTEKDLGYKYRGYGLSTNYGIHKRSSTSFFWGGKFSYNIGSVTREAIADEPKRERSLTLGWLSMALEVGFFY